MKSYKELLEIATTDFKDRIELNPDGTEIKTHSLTQDMGFIVLILSHPDNTITSFNLSGNQITQREVERLAEALKFKHCKLTSLNISHMKSNLLEERVIDDIITLILTQPDNTITSLNLSGNRIRVEEAERLAFALQSEHCKLKSLNLSHNEIGFSIQTPLINTGFAHALLSEHCKLVSLNLSGNNINSKDLDDIIQKIIQQNFRIIFLRSDNATKKMSTSDEKAIEVKKEILNNDDNFSYIPNQLRTPSLMEGVLPEFVITQMATSLDKEPSKLDHNQIFLDLFYQDPNASTHIPKLISDRAQTIHLLSETCSEDPTLYLDSWGKYCHRWIWSNVNSSPFLRTAEIFKACYALIGNEELFSINLENAITDAASKPSYHTIQTTFMGQAIHQELSFITQDLSIAENQRITSLFETMIKLDVNFFMDFISEHYNGFIDQAITIIYELLENNVKFRESPEGFEALSQYLAHQVFEEGAILGQDDLNKFIQIVNWSKYYTENPAATPLISEADMISRLKPAIPGLGFIEKPSLEKLHKRLSSADNKDKYTLNELIEIVQQTKRITLRSTFDALRKYSIINNTKPVARSSNETPESALQPEYPTDAPKCA
ncbi:MAG TPA: hypothetical protein QF353_01255 [Gammaproteobacteria bacterium]|nr:hypothetical protein [Gammaproteobacteria bacterium]